MVHHLPAARAARGFGDAVARQDESIPRPPAAISASTLLSILVHDRRRARPDRSLVEPRAGQRIRATDHPVGFLITLMRLAHFELNILACVDCGGELRLSATTTAGDGHVMEGTLACAGCARSYPIVRGVPRMTPAQFTQDVHDTVGAFGYQWKQANDILKQGFFSTPECFLDFIEPVEPSFFRDKIVLDGGCGIGRFTIWSASWGARLAIGVDLSDSVDVAFENTRQLPNVLIVQADILALPVQRKIDYAFSVAVLHHTADPRGG